MPKKKIDFDVVRELALALPGVTESKTYREPSLKVGGKLLACPAINKSAEPNSLVVCIDADQRAVLLAAEPDVYYVTDHYANHSMVLVRMAAIDRKSLKALLDDARRFVSATKRKTS